DALETVRSFASALQGPNPQACWGQHNVVLGLQVDMYLDDEISEGVDLRKALGEFGRLGFRATYVWTKDSDEALLANWPSGLPRPAYDEFSYGAARNDLLLLADLAGAQVVCFIDPGCKPVEHSSWWQAPHILPGISCLSFQELLEVHISELYEGGTVAVSG